VIGPIVSEVKPRGQVMPRTVSCAGITLSGPRASTCTFTGRAAQWLFWAAAGMAKAMKAMTAKLPLIMDVVPCSLRSGNTAPIQIALKESD
jgi:hypothetical protein